MPGDVKWIKIVTDIFDDEKMYAIESLPDGMQIEVVCDRTRFIWSRCLYHVLTCRPTAKLCHEQDYNYHFLHVRFLLTASLPVR